MTVTKPIYSSVAGRWLITWHDGQRRHSAWYVTKARALIKYAALKLEGYILYEGDNHE